jgi:hypothetical protein
MEKCCQGTHTCFNCNIWRCPSTAVWLQFCFVQHTRHAEAPKAYAYRANVAHYNSSPLHHCRKRECTERRQPDQSGRDWRKKYNHDGEHDGSPIVYLTYDKLKRLREKERYTMRCTFLVWLVLENVFYISAASLPVNFCVHRFCA